MVGHGPRREVEGNGMWDMMGNSWRCEMAHNWGQCMLGGDRQWCEVAHGGKQQAVLGWDRGLLGTHKWEKTPQQWRTQWSP